MFFSGSFKISPNKDNKVFIDFSIESKNHKSWNACIFMGNHVMKSAKWGLRLRFGLKWQNSLFTWVIICASFMVLFYLAGWMHECKGKRLSSLLTESFSLLDGEEQLFFQLFEAFVRRQIQSVKTARDRREWDVYFIYRRHLISSIALTRCDSSAATSLCQPSQCRTSEGRCFLEDEVQKWKIQMNHAVTQIF